MSPDDVFGDEMNEPHDFDDEAAESLLAGTGRSIDPELADLLGDVHVAFTSTPPAVGAELAALIGPPVPVVTPIGRWTRMRSSMLAKVAAGIAAAMAATGGLAVAGALPSPVQHAIDHIGGDENGPHHGHDVVDDETTTTVEGETTTTVEDNHDQNDDNNNDNHGDDVSGVAHDHEGECQHGHDVSEVASDGRTNSPCVTPGSTDPTSPTTVDDHGHDGDNENHDGNDDNGDDNETPTTVGNTPTTVDNSGHDGNGDQSGDNHGGDSGSSHGDSGSNHGSGDGGGD